VIFTILLSSVIAVVPSKIENLKKALKPWGSEAGFSLVDSKKREIFQHNGHEFYTPASIAKMISMACSLKELGPQYQFQTKFGATGSITPGGVLQGDLVIEGLGDPTFVIENLKENLERLFVVMGVREIKGSLIFLNRYFEKNTYEIADGFEGDSSRAFTARLTSSPLNFNSFSVWVSGRTGFARAEILPKDVWDIKVSNHLTVHPGAPNVQINYPVGKNGLSVSGGISREMEPRAWYRSLPDPYGSFARLVTRIWDELGGTWTAPKYQVVSTPLNYTLLFTHLSQPLSKIMMDINKLSTNFAAEMVLMAAASGGGKRSTSPEKAVSYLRSCIESFPGDAKGLILGNASGLSREAKIRPSSFAGFLQEIPSTNVWPEYASTLSVLGRDGTTKSRMKEFEGRARLKTGSLSTVKSLAGYVFPKFEAAPMSFVLVVECKTASCTPQRIRGLEDQVLETLLSWGPEE